MGLTGNRRLYRTRMESLIEAIQRVYWIEPVKTVFENIKVSYGSWVGV